MVLLSYNVYMFYDRAIDNLRLKDTFISFDICSSEKS